MTLSLGDLQAQVTLSSRRPSGPGDNQLVPGDPEAQVTPSPGDPQACERLASHSRALAMPPSRAPRPAPRAPSQGHRAPAEARERGYGPAPLTIAVVVLHGAGDRLRTPGPRPPLTSHSPSPLRHQLVSDKLRAPEPRPPRRARTAQHTPAHAPLAAPPPAQDPAHNKSARAQTPSQRPHTWRPLVGICACTVYTTPP